MNNVITGLAIGYQAYNVSRAGLSYLEQTSPKVYDTAEKIRSKIIGFDFVAATGCYITFLLLQMRMAINPQTTISRSKKKDSQAVLFVDRLQWDIVLKPLYQ